MKYGVGSYYNATRRIAAWRKNLKLPWHNTTTTNTAYAYILATTSTRGHGYIWREQWGQRRTVHSGERSFVMHPNVELWSMVAGNERQGQEILVLVNELQPCSVTPLDRMGRMWSSCSLSDVAKQLRKGQSVIVTGQNAIHATTVCYWSFADCSAQKNTQKTMLYGWLKDAFLVARNERVSRGPRFLSLVTTVLWNVDIKSVGVIIIIVRGVHDHYAVLCTVEWFSAYTMKVSCVVNGVQNGRLQVPFSLTTTFSQTTTADFRYPASLHEFEAHAVLLHTALQTPHLQQHSCCTWTRSVSHT